MTRAPQVSIGLPVRNGANYLADAIHSILTQTFTDFELIIGDNASDDATQEICLEAAAADDRVRVSRHDHDLGAPANYNYVFTQASAPLFRWAAHDDITEPEHLSACVAALAAEPHGVLAAPDAVIFDEHRPDRAWQLPGALSLPRPGQRLLAAAVTFAGPAVFSLVRSEALRSTRLHQASTSADLVLVSELALRGPFVRVPQQLFRMRRHDSAYGRAVLGGPDEAAWLDPTVPAHRMRTGRGSLRIVAGCARAIHEAPLRTRERPECWKALIKLSWQRRRVLVLHLAGALRDGLRRIAGRT